MTTFSDSEIKDVSELQNAADALAADSVVIGAMAYRAFIDDVERETYDIDLAVALDLDDFQKLAEALAALGWRRSDVQEQRWITARGNRLDIVPAGASLRREGALRWPRSGFVMSLAGFDHVFEDAVSLEVGKGLLVKIVPPPVLALLKIAAYMDNPLLRQKDLSDLRRLMHRYEGGSDRIFSDAVFEAELPDVEFAGAFLLGLDLGSLSGTSDTTLIESLLERMANIDSGTGASVSPDDDWTMRDASRFQQQLLAFSKGFRARQR